MKKSLAKLPKEFGEEIPARLCHSGGRGLFSEYNL